MQGFVLANDLATIAITRCSVDTQAPFDVHSPIVIQVCPRDFSPTVFVARKPRSFDWQKLRQICIQRIAEEKQSSRHSDGTMNHKSPTDEEIRNYEQYSLENSFRKHLSRVENQLDEALARKDPTEFWRMWSMATKDGIVDVCVNTARHRGNRSWDTGLRSTLSEDTKPHKFSKTTADTPLSPPKPLNSISSRNRYTKSCNTSGDPDKLTPTVGRLTSPTLGKVRPRTITGTCIQT